MKNFQTSREEYVAVLLNEIETLRRYYNPFEEGTGHFSTAISVLEHRVKELNTIQDATA